MKLSFRATLTTTTLVYLLSSAITTNCQSHREELRTMGSSLFIEFTPALTDNMFPESFGQYLLLNQILVNDIGDNP